MSQVTTFQGVICTAALAVTAWLVYLRFTPPRVRAESTEFTGPVVDEGSGSPSTGEVIIAFGSQTGTSESFAQEIVEEARNEFGISCADPGAQSVEHIDFGALFEPSDKKVNLVLLLSTYGEGDASDDATTFDELLGSLVSEHPDSSLLSHVNFAIFGLGNRQYALFNAMAKRTEKRLLSLGAHRVCLTGFGDDNQDIEKDFGEWKNEVFWPGLLRESFGVNNPATARAKQVDRDPLSKLALNVAVANKRSQLPFDALVQSGGEVVSKFYFACNIVPVVEVRKLCEGKVHIEVDISKVPSLRYRTGDVLDVLPINRTEDTEWLMSEYTLERESFMTFTKRDRPNSSKKLTVKKPFPTPCTVYQAVSRYVDLASSPSRKFIREIAMAALGESFEEAEALAEEIKQREGSSFITVKSFLQQYVVDIKDKIRFGDIVQLLPKQKPRAYSICSSHLIDPKRIALVISKVDEHALASVWMTKEVKVNDTFLVSLKPGVFRLPTLPSIPVIMICTGTGFAPFRAFIAEMKLKQRVAPMKSVLFFGCRNESEWIYREEMEDFKNLGGTLHVAFSRQIPGNVQYVQHLIQEQTDMISELVTKQNAVVYVCGSTAMGRDVTKVIDSIVSVTDLRTEKRFIEELWG